MPRRPTTVNLLLVATALLAALSGPVVYVGGIVDDEERFVAVAERAVAHPEVRDAIAVQVTELTFDAIEADEIVADALPEGTETFAVPLTQIASTQLTAAAFAALDSELARAATDPALRELHRQATDDSDELVIDLRGVLVRTAREVGGPTIGAAVAQVVSGSEVGRYTVAAAGSDEAALVAALRATPVVGQAALLSAVLTLVLATVVATDRRRALVLGGLALAAGAIVSAVLVSTVLFAVLGVGTGSQADLGRALVDVVAADYGEQQRGVVVVGVVLAAIGLALGDRPSASALRRLPAQLWRRDRAAAVGSVATLVGDNPPVARLSAWSLGALVLAGWDLPTWRVILTVMALTAVALALVWSFTGDGAAARALRERVGVPEPGLEPIAGRHRWSRLRGNLAVGLALLFLFWPAWDRSLVVSFFIVAAITQGLCDVVPARRFDAATAPAVIDDHGPWWDRRWVMAGVAGVAALALGGALTLAADDEVFAADGCNGHVELCDRRIDEVTFAGSHNSMSSTDLGWDLAMQTGDIVAQLDHGVRALLIDTHYWDRPGMVEGGDDGAAAAVIEAALADDVPRPGVWLCHGFCALGATAFDATLAEINIWLDANPREVVMMVIQDETSTADVMAAFEATGLLEKVHDHRPGTPWPTLGSLVERNERLIVMAENEGSPDSWYQNVFDNMTETPFDFALRSEFSCDPNRGDPENDLFLINHWVTTGIPVREAAAAINDREALLDRVAQCEDERGRRPTIIAVDFVETGDLVSTVDELNGVADP